MDWHKSTACATDKACVEVARMANGNVMVRDGKNPDYAALIFTPEEWTAFTDGVQAGEFDIDKLVK